MKAKTSAALFVAILFLSTQLSLRAQVDCYNIQCPSNVFAPCEGVYGAHAWFSVTASNLCNPSSPPIVTYSVAPGSVFPPGTNTVCAVIQIPGVAPRQCCFNVIVDSCCPTNCIDVICPSNVVVGCQQAAGTPGAQVALPSPRATNYCGDHLVPASLVWRCTPPLQASGTPTFFPPGTNTVVCCLTDGQFYLNCCCFQVIVTNCPLTPNLCTPQIACPTNVEVQCEGPNGAIVFFPPPKIIDPCGLVIGTNVTHLSGAFFPNGKTTVAACIVWRDPATGLLLNECCCFDVVVRCCPPTNCISRLDCPTNIVVDCPPAAGIVLNYTVFGTNNCEPTTLVCNPPPGTVINGPVTVCCKLLNSSGVVLTQCCFNVTIQDTTPPVIQCPPSITVVSSNCQPVAVVLPVVTATDNCDPHPVVTCNSTAAAFPCGTTTITCTAVDASGNSNKCSFTVTVICDGRPQITCPPDMVFRCVSPTGVVVNYSVMATNPCSPTVPPITCTPPSGSVFLPGAYTVCCQVNDPTVPAPVVCCFKVTVQADDIPPSILCPTNIVVLTPNCVPIAVNYPPPSATDNCQLDFVRCLPLPTSTFPIGVTTVTCCAVDKVGNSNCCSFTVTVRCPTNCDQVVCPSNIVVNCAGPNGAVVSYKPYATNLCTGAQSPLFCFPPSGSLFPPGTTTVCCTNTATANALGICCFKVTVRSDTMPPSILCPSNVVAIAPNCAPIEVVYPPPGATDDCQLDSVTCKPLSGSLFPPGLTTVTCCAVDKAGNSNCCSFTVTVRCPTNCIQVVCPSNIVTDCAGPTGAVITYEAYVINVCTGVESPLLCAPPSGTLFPPGVTTVCCTNTATAGAVAICCFTVSVRPDIIPPSITCPSNIVVGSPNCSSINVVYPAPTATDNCQVASVTCTPPSGAAFPPGTTTVDCCALDKAGNFNCCSFTVTVLCPTDCIRVVCPSNIVTDCTGPNGAAVSYNAYVTNICTGDAVALPCTPPSGSFFPPGVTKVCCTNTATGSTVGICCFTVTVRCPTNCTVQVVCPSNTVVECSGPNGSAVSFNAYGINLCTGGLVPVVCSPPSGSTFPPGVTTVCCTNAVSGAVPAWCCFTVTVRPDTKPPVINCSSNIYVLCAKPRGAKVSYVVTASDNCDSTVSLTCLPTSGSVFPLGCTNVTCVAVDHAGNASTCTFRVCVLPQSCYLVNPSFETLIANPPPATFCGDAISLATGWAALSGTPDLFRPPFASLAPGNCRGRENPCQGTNYAGLEGGYTTSGGFVTEEMIGTLMAPLNAGVRFRLRACLSLAESSQGPVVVEFVLANSANLAQQQVIHQVTVTQKNGWLQYLPPCFVVPPGGNWDRLIIRLAQVGPGLQPYPVGYVYVDNVNICCCSPTIKNVVLTPTTVTVSWEGSGQLQGAGLLGDEGEWQDIASPVEMDPDTGDYSTTFPRPAGNLHFRIVAPDATPDCAECGAGG